MTAQSVHAKEMHNSHITDGVCWEPSPRQARQFFEIFVVQLNNENFFGEISRISFALFVRRNSWHIWCSFFFFFFLERCYAV